jgi:NAD(P)-dependent dehydrogenase (short-subunit alcohol dehydrogenase family)
LAAGKPKLVILAGRDRKKIQPVIDQISNSDPDVPVIFIALDLASQSSIRETAKQINSKIESLDLLINNAGSMYLLSALSRRSNKCILVMATKDYTVTADGVELQFGVNHIGHFLLTNLLMEKILAAKIGARIINISRFGYIMSGIRDDWDFKVPFNDTVNFKLLTLKIRKRPTTLGSAMANPRPQISYSHPQFHGS